MPCTIVHSYFHLPFGKGQHSNVLFANHCRIPKRITPSYKKEGVFIEKENKKQTRQDNAGKEEHSPVKSPRQIYDRIFKRIFSLSKKSIIHLINGLFGKEFPPDSTVEYPNKEFVLPGLENRIADIIVVINNIHAFHLEGQMEKDDIIVLRVFEYGFQYAMSARAEPDRLEFPEPVVIYLGKSQGIPEESILHISFGSQGVFDYHVKNYLYLAHDVEELNRQKMIVFIPFQVLRLRSLVNQWKTAKKENKFFDRDRFFRLQKKINDDIINSIELNLELKNITTDDARQLTELTNQLYRHIYRDLELMGGEENMNPLLPGALELPNDKYRFKIDELEKEIARYADENARYADENARYADENARLKKKIAELETQSMSN